MDTDAKTDKVWLLGVQRKLYQWSRENPEGAYRELWGWVTDIRNLRCAWRTVAANKGKRTPGVDGVTVKHIQKLGVDTYLEGVRKELQDRSYAPFPARRVWIPKPGKPGEFRPLGVPTVKDRIVQCAVKQIIEPLFEASVPSCIVWLQARTELSRSLRAYPQGNPFPEKGGRWQKE